LACGALAHKMSMLSSSIARANWVAPSPPRGCFALTSENGGFVAVERDRLSAF